MRDDLESSSERLLDYLVNNPAPDGFQEIMKLKLELGLSASKLFLTLGWLLREGRIELESSEYGYKVRCPADTVDPRLTEKTSG